MARYAGRSTVVARMGRTEAPTLPNLWALCPPEKPSSRVLRLLLIDFPDLGRTPKLVQLTPGPGLRP